MSEVNYLDATIHKLILQPYLYIKIHDDFKKGFGKCRNNDRDRITK